MDFAIVGIIVGIVAMMLMIIKTRIPVALAMVIACLIMGMFAGMAPKELVVAITTGFGAVLGGIGLIIAFGVIMGACFEKSGAAVRMAKTFVGICGKGREDIALGLTGVLVAIPVFCDSAYVLFVITSYSIHYTKLYDAEFMRPFEYGHQLRVQHAE